jgi:GDP-4-dehydro-6-deoxy-D-mannose reductase
MPTSSGFARGDEQLLPMRVLVTGAAGFVGRHLVPRLAEQGHDVTAGCRPVEQLDDSLREQWGDAVQVVSLELAEREGVRAAVEPVPDAVIHLAAIASVREAREDPTRAWVVNAVGTARLMDAVLAAGTAAGRDPLVLVVSTAEVYGNGSGRARVETDVPAPQSPYAASKLAGEIAALEAWRRGGLRVTVARPFIHTGPGQRPPYVIPSFIQRLLAVKAGNAPGRVPTGNMEIVRDLLDVRDVVEAYILLLLRGRPGEIYNVARGSGYTLRDIFQKIAREIGVKAEPVSDPTLIRAGDIPHLVGDSAKLRGDTGWSPAFSLEQTLRDMVHAQAH